MRAGVLAGAVMGAVGGLTTRLRLGPGGRPVGRAGALAASMWVGGVSARLAFAVAAGNGAGPAIARFSIAHHITGSAAWAAALVMMALADVLSRLVVIYLRGHKMAAGSAATVARIPAGVRADLVSPPAAGHTVCMKARLAAAGLIHGAARPAPAAGGTDEPGSARVAEAPERARDRPGDSGETVRDHSRSQAASPGQDAADQAARAARVRRRQPVRATDGGTGGRGRRHRENRRRSEDPGHALGGILLPGIGAIPGAIAGHANRRPGRSPSPSREAATPSSP